MITPADERLLLDRVAALLAWLQPVYGLQDWGITVLQARLDDAKMAIDVYPEYREAELKVDPLELSHVDDEALVETVAHELSHARVAEFIALWRRVDRKGRTHLEEALVCDVTGTVLRAYRSGLAGETV